MEEITAKILLRNDTKAKWESVNPVLAKGEAGVVTIGEDHGRIKIGDGIKKWKELPYSEISYYIQDMYNKGHLTTGIEQAGVGVMCATGANEKLFSYPLVQFKQWLTDINIGISNMQQETTGSDFVTEIYQPESKGVLMTDINKGATAFAADNTAFKQWLSDIGAVGGVDGDIDINNIVQNTTGGNFYNNFTCNPGILTIDAAEGSRAQAIGLEHFKQWLTDISEEVLEGQIPKSPIIVTQDEEDPNVINVDAYGDPGIYCFCISDRENVYGVPDKIHGDFMLKVYKWGRKENSIVQEIVGYSEEGNVLTYKRIWVHPYMQGGHTYGWTLQTFNVENAEEQTTSGPLATGTYYLLWDGEKIKLGRMGW